MNKITYTFYNSKLWTFILRLTGRVPAGFFIGWGRWMTLKDAQLCVGPGWANLVKQGFDLCLKRGARIIQIKEKFGGLRFYCEIDGTDEFTKLNIEGQSYNICEECGKPGKAREGGWIKTLCDECVAPDVRLRRRQKNWQ